LNQENKKTDRYVSFAGIDCTGNSRKLMAMLLGHIGDAPNSDPFWEKFRTKLERAGTPGNPDELFLIHAYINNIREFFEACDDRDALALLDQIEKECC